MTRRIRNDAETTRVTSHESRVRDTIRTSYLVPRTSARLGEQIMQIHDSILVECARENAEAVSALLKETMENIYPELGIRLDVDVHSGENWGEV